MFTPDYEGALVMPAVADDGSLHYFGKDGDQKNTPAWIVIHGTAGGSSAQSIAHYFTTVPNSTHYVIGRDGLVVQCVPEQYGAWGNAPAEVGCQPYFSTLDNPNFYTISIELVKTTPDNSETPAQAQMASLVSLVKDIHRRRGIPLQLGDARGGLVPHSWICPVDRAHCPGTFDWQGFIATLNADMTTIPSGWTDETSTNTLYGPPDETGHRVPIVKGFYNTMKTGAYWHLGVPRAPEFVSDNVRLNTTNVKGSLQFFEYGALCWEAATGAIYQLQAGDVIQTFLRNQIPVPNEQTVDLPN